MRALRIDDHSSPRQPVFDFVVPGEREVLLEKTFRRMIAIERKRTDRSQEPFLLMLVNLGSGVDRENSYAILNRITSVLLVSSRETDVVGWYTENTTVGVLFTGLVLQDKSLILATLLRRISSMLENELPFEQFNQVSLSFHFYPDDWDQSRSSQPVSTVLYPDLMNPKGRKRSLLVVKRGIDIVGSALALTLLSPLLLLIALAIKLTSKGPVLFKQQRVGQYGRLFTVLKFRSMHVDNDPGVHKEYVMKLISDEAQRQAADAGAGGGVYKLTNDRRITTLGRFLRRASLDELPQFLNVLSGRMSLVGPRPAIPYELAAYQSWHRRRILEAKPGITGLWQVTGRSLVKFDDMVRLDLRYANSWSLWLDFVILIRTPLAVIRGAGAY